LEFDAGEMGLGFSVNKAAVRGSSEWAGDVLLGHHGGEQRSMLLDVGYSREVFMAAWWSSCMAAWIFYCDIGPVRPPASHCNVHGSKSSMA
jgi:hypothetical protein